MPIIASVSTYLANLPRRRCLTLSGPDSRSFLQGQSTCDIDELRNGGSLTGAFCNPQGRMFADFTVWQFAEDHLVLSLDSSLIEPLQATLSKYLAFSKAELGNPGSGLANWAIWGDAASVIADTGTAEPGWSFAGARVRPSAVSGAYDMLVPDDCEAAMQDALSASIPADESAWHYLEIVNGIGHVHQLTSGLFLPQMLNYQLTGQVSFTKGCYTGQEVVARMHYRGKVKRPMQYCIVDAPDILDAPEPGTTLHRPGSEQAIGHVVSAVVRERQIHMLASLARDTAQDATLGLDGPSLQTQVLPYTLPDTD